MSLKDDAEKYVKALRGPANGWGQFIIHNEQSHVFQVKCLSNMEKIKSWTFWKKTTGAKKNEYILSVRRTQSSR